MSDDPTPPVDSYREAAPYLRRPFTDEAVRFKVQAAWPKGNPTSGLIVAYIDARLAIERLNHVLAELWSDEYEMVGQGQLMCRLTVDGITRRDIGEGYQGKGLYSDALKRAAVKFGVGVSLYAVPKIILRQGQHLEAKGRGDKSTLALTSDGEKHCRTLYSSWLVSHGIKAFGEPLDHGDVADAIGDTEVEQDEQPIQTVEEPQPIGDERAAKLDEFVVDAGLAEHLSNKLRGMGKTTLAELTEPEAMTVYRWAEQRQTPDDPDGYDAFHGSDLPPDSQTKQADVDAAWEASRPVETK